MTSDSLGDVLDRQPLEERRRAARALLRRPLLTAGADPAAFALVRRHAERLRQTFWDEAGWVLRVDSRIARLRKEPADSADVTRPALAPPANQAFSGRRYVVLCLVLAALERADRQVTVGRLADQVVLAAGETKLREAGFAFTLDSADGRRELVAVVRLLLELHALERVAGDEGAYVAASGDALYDVDRRVLGGLMITRRGPSLTSAGTVAEGLEALRDDAPQTDDLRNRALRHRLSRRLLDDPVVYYTRLPADELAYLTSQRPHLRRRLQEATGLVPEVRQEGIALLDPTGQASDLRMPEEGTDGHATLLVAEYLAETLRMGPTGAIPWETLERLLERAAEAHKSFWRREAREPGAARPLARFAVHRLEALGLVRLEAEGVRPEPAIARFAYREPVLHASGAAKP